MPKELESGVDYPQLYREFVEWFPDNKACLDYLEKLRWPNGFTCPECNFQLSLGDKLGAD